MAISLNKIVPWGRSLEEYVRMFDLKAADLRSRILDCAGGPASFNAEMYRSGRTVISCDPIYQFSTPEIARRIDETYPAILDATRRSGSNFVWREVRSPEHLGELRKQAMKLFLEDFPIGVSQGRYRVGERRTDLGTPDGASSSELACRIGIVIENIRWAAGLVTPRSAIRKAKLENGAVVVSKQQGFIMWVPRSVRGEAVIP